MIGRFIGVALIGLAIGSARERPIPDLNGIWTADLSKSNFGELSQPTSVIMHVEQDASHLEIVEFVKGDQGSSVAERSFTAKAGKKTPFAFLRSGGNTVTLQYTHRGSNPAILEKWTILNGGEELIASRWIGRSGRRQHVVVFKRSTEILAHR